GYGEKGRRSTALPYWRTPVESKLSAQSVSCRGTLADRLCGACRGAREGDIGGRGERKETARWGSRSPAAPAGERCSAPGLPAPPSSFPSPVSRGSGPRMVGWLAAGCSICAKVTYGLRSRLAPSRSLNDPSAHAKGSQHGESTRAISVAHSQAARIQKVCRS